VRWAALGGAVVLYLAWLYVAWDEVRHNALKRAQQRPPPKLGAVAGTASMGSHTDPGWSPQPAPARAPLPGQTPQGAVQGP
jgi:hypothetical protein